MVDDGAGYDDANMELFLYTVRPCTSHRQVACRNPIYWQLAHLIGDWEYDFICSRVVRPCKNEASIMCAWLLFSSSRLRKNQQNVKMVNGIF